MAGSNDHDRDGREGGGDELDNFRHHPVVQEFLDRFSPGGFIVGTGPDGKVKSRLWFNPRFDGTKKGAK